MNDQVRSTLIRVDPSTQRKWSSEGVIRLGDELVSNKKKNNSSMVQWLDQTKAISEMK